MPDTELINKLKDGDPQAFSSFINEYSGLVYTISLNILQNKEEAEDATQEVFIIVYQSINSFKGDSKISTWLYTIATNKCREIIRRKNRKKRFGFLMPLEDKTVIQSRNDFMHPGIELEKQERAAVLFGAIEKLPENQRVAFTLNKIEGLPYDETAQIMNLSLGAVESLLFRAKQNLKTHLSSYYDENEL